MKITIDTNNNTLLRDNVATSLCTLNGANRIVVARPNNEISITQDQKVAIRNRLDNEVTKKWIQARKEQAINTQELREQNIENDSYLGHAYEDVTYSKLNGPIITKTF